MQISAAEVTRSVASLKTLSPRIIALAGVVILVGGCVFILLLEGVAHPGLPFFELVGQSFKDMVDFCKAVYGLVKWMGSAFSATAAFGASVSGGGVSH